MRRVPQLNAQLSADAMAGWRRVSATHGASITALAEAMGRSWQAMTDDEILAPSPTLTAMIAEARRIDADRRRRRR